MDKQPVQAKTSFQEPIEKIKQRVRKTPRNILVPVLLLVIIVVALLILAVSRLNPTGNQLVDENTPPYAHTDLKVELQSDFGDSGEAGVSITTGENAVTAVQLELTYDPDVLTNVTLRPGSFFPTSTVLLEKIDEENGKITYALGVGIGQKGIKGSGNVAVISFDEKESSTETTFIKFLPETVVTANNTAPSVLRSATGALFSLEGVSAPSASPNTK